MLTNLEKEVIKEETNVKPKDLYDMLETGNFDGLDKILRGDEDSDTIDEIRIKMANKNKKEKKDEKV